MQHEETEFGILLDIDGVISHGAEPIPEAKEAFSLLKDPVTQKARYPVIFVTNGLDRDCIKAQHLSRMLDIEVVPNQVIHAPSPLEVFYSFHQKRVLLVGQENLSEIAEDIGFTNYCFIEDVVDAFPLLDIVDHANRTKLKKNPKIVESAKTASKEFQNIEAILVMGEPVRWETALQIILDLIMTDGNPNNVLDEMPMPHIPILACNMDLVFKANAPLPRFGNGSFLACLEILFKRISGFRLQYTAIVGKPCEITTRYAEHCLTREKAKLGIHADIKRIYFIGDNPNVDIAAANWYNDFLKRQRRRRESSSESDTEKDYDDMIPSSRNMPREAVFLPQTAQMCEGILVKTGVFNPQAATKVMKNHKDICLNRIQLKPRHIADTVLQAIGYILRRENIPCPELDERINGTVSSSSGGGGAGSDPPVVMKIVSGRRDSKERMRKEIELNKHIARLKVDADHSSEVSSTDEDVFGN